MPRKRAVLVLGMHRSGTSAVSRFVNMLGFDLGEHLMAPRKDNPKGFWENEEIIHHNEELMAPPVCGGILLSLMCHWS